MGARVESTGIQLRLLPGPSICCDGSAIGVPEGSKRLLVYVALRRRVNRAAAARALWPDVDPSRAAGNLRSAVWRLRCAGIEVLRSNPDGSLELAADAWVDLWALRQSADQLLDGGGGVDAGFLTGAVEALDLLPGWYDDWIVAERDGLRTRVLAALDALAHQLLRAGRGGEAVDVALVSVGADPMRESSQTILVAAHLSEGNFCEARRAYRTYCRLLEAELGIAGTERIERLLRRARPAPMTVAPVAISQSRRPSPDLPRTSHEPARPVAGRGGLRAHAAAGR